MDTKRAEKYLLEIGFDDAHLPNLFNDDDKSYYTIPELMTDFNNEETKQLKEQNQSCAEFLKRMLSISELWTYDGEVKLEHENEAKALESMKNEAEQLLKDLEPTKEQS